MGSEVARQLLLEQLRNPLNAFLFGLLVGAMLMGAYHDRDSDSCGNRTASECMAEKQAMTDD